MEFTLALEMALQQGLTKEEFMHLWEVESKLGSRKGQREHLSEASLQIPYNTKNDEFVKDFHQMCKLHLEKQEKQWQKIDAKFSEMTEEIRKNFGILCQHVSNTTEAHTSALKLNFLQECDILRQDLRKHVESFPTTSISTPSSSLPPCASFEQSGSANGEKPQPNLNSFDDTARNNRNFGKTDKILATARKCSSKKAELDDKNEVDLFDSPYGWHMDDIEDTMFHVNEPAKNSPLATKIKAENNNLPPPNSLKRNARGIVHEKTAISDNRSVCAKTDGDILRPSASSVSSNDNKSVKATGFYAETISSQMKNPSPQGSPTSDKPTTYNSKIIMSSKVVSQNDWPTFTIYDSAKFIASGAIHLTPYIIKKSWKGRLRVSFDAAQKLKVRVLISAGEDNTEVIWPLKFSGEGSIYHQGSRRYTQVWQLHPVRCQKPGSGKEVEFETKVCLSTLRGSYPDVKFRELVSRLYAESNRMTFQWNLISTNG